MFLAISLLFRVGNIASAQDARVVPNVTSVSIAGDCVTLLHLAPGYTTSVNLPEQVSSVVIGDPASFKAEHSDAEPRLVFLKPITEQPAESNALITTKSGQEVSLHLMSPGKTDQDPKVDFLVQYRPPQSVLVDADTQSC
jgi:type IV secretory pathway VirB9-like protein